jgi:hypothetical protein
VQDGDCAGGRHPEDGATIERTTEKGRPVEISIVRLDEGGSGIVSIRPANERVQDGDGAGRRHPEDGATIEGAARSGRPVEVPVGCLDEGGAGLGSIRTASERVQNRDRPCRFYRRRRHRCDHRRKKDAKICALSTAHCNCSEVSYPEGDAGGEA